MLGLALELFVVGRDQQNQRALREERGSLLLESLWLQYYAQTGKEYEDIQSLELDEYIPLELHSRL